MPSSPNRSGDDSSGAEQSPSAGTAPAEGRPSSEPAQPEVASYGNLWVPLIVVPAAVVGVLLIVYVIFGSITGKEASLEGNLERMIRGGANEREQAAFSLVRQLRAVREGREREWQVTPEFLERVRRAWDETTSSDLEMRLVLALILAQEGDPDARPRLVELARVSDEADPKGEVRVHALLGLSWIGGSEAAAEVAVLLKHGDPGLRLAAAAALQAMPGEATVEALKGALEDRELEVRGMAAISLSHLGDASGHALLTDLLDPAIYRAAQDQDPRKFQDPRLVQHTRIKAIQALGRLNRSGDRERLTGLAETDSDLEVREAARRALSLLVN